MLSFVWIKTSTSTAPGGRINIKMSSYQYRKSHCGDKTIWWPSYLYNGISYTGKIKSLYWIRAHEGISSYSTLSQVDSTSKWIIQVSICWTCSWRIYVEDDTLWNDDNLSFWKKMIRISQISTQRNICSLIESSYPMNMRRINNVIITSKRHFTVVLMTLLLRHVSAGLSFIT